MLYLVLYEHINVVEQTYLMADGCVSRKHMYVPVGVSLHSVSFTVSKGHNLSA